MVYDNIIRARVVLFDIESDLLNIGDDVFTETKATYNIQNFEVYHYDIDFSEYLNHKKILIKTTCSSDLFDTEIHLSEIINLKDWHNDTLYVEYYNTTTKDFDNIFWGDFTFRGIVRLQVDIENETQRASNTTTINGLNNTTTVSNDLRDALEYSFRAVPSKLANRIPKYYNHDILLLNGVRYADQNIEEDEPLGASNLKSITMSAIRADKVHGLTPIQGIVDQTLQLDQSNSGGLNLVTSEEGEVRPIKHT